VPLLCGALLWRSRHRDLAPRRQDKRSTSGSDRLTSQEVPRKGQEEKRRGSELAVASLRIGNRVLFHQPSAILIWLALLWLATRLVQTANPEWRLVSWALALEVVGLTLVCVHLAAGGERLKQLAFPICFFLVAVPWPSFVEAPLIQGLTRANARLAVESLGWWGVPAVAHGNVIEVAGGAVGLDEACSGIRSLQSTLMISLFLGELYRLAWRRRAVLCLAGFALAICFNAGRTFFLVWVGARDGMGAVQNWHDPAGVSLMLACLVSLWGVGEWLKARQEAKRGGPQPTPDANGHGEEPSGRQPSPDVRSPTCGARPTAFPSGRPSSLRPLTSPNTLRVMPWALVVWLVLTEVGVEMWYRLHEGRLPPAVEWTVAWPTDNPTLREVPLPERTKQILRYDEGQRATWREGDVRWQAVYLRWKAGRTAAHLARNHTPEVCLTAAGHRITAVSGLRWVEVLGLRLPFHAFTVETAAGPRHVFYCLWEDRAADRGFETLSLTYGRRLAAVLAGHRNLGQRSLEIAVGEIETLQMAEKLISQSLSDLVRLAKGPRQTSGPLPFPAPRTGLPSNAAGTGRPGAKS
jgi:exosortase